LILTAASEIYARAARWRRRWYSARPSRQRRLSHPVISVGNLRVGGAGKTPLVAAVARILIARGERPDILSRGYARKAGGYVVVADEHQVRAPIESAGDEPLMLARELKGVPVVVGADRFTSGRIAEQRFATTVHLLDDGFQHLELARDVDLVVADEIDLNDKVLPAGRLREPLSVAAVADAMLTTAAPEDVERLRQATGLDSVFRVARTLGAPVAFLGDRSRQLTRGPAFAFAGIARPENFFDELTRSGWTLTGTKRFSDHHWFSASDLAHVERAARSSGAEIVLTTEKDRQRLEQFTVEHVTVAAVPLEVTIEPSFEDWLLDRLAARRQRA
jgi:tetraacyldisaccharide 4'-kinase